MVEESHEHHEKKRIFRGQSYEENKTRISELSGTKTEFLEKLAVWQKLLSSIVTPGSTHGGSKEPSMTWVSFFEQTLGEELKDPPLAFESAEVPFDKVILLVSIQISGLQKEHDALAKKVSNLDSRLQRADRQAQAKLDAAKRKADALVQQKRDGAEEQINEQKRHSSKKNVLSCYVYEFLWHFSRNP